MADGHDRLSSHAPESITLGGLQVPPLKVSDAPRVSTAMQKLEEGHETSSIWPLVGSRLLGVLHDLPSKVNALPLLSTATQKLLDAHDTDVGIDAGSMAPGADHDNVTVTTRVCVAVKPKVSRAVMVTGYAPAVSGAGVPLRVAVPSPLSVNVTPEGRVPDSANDGVGEPVAVTVNVPADPVVNVVDAADVMAGAWSTVRTKFWLTDGPTPLAAVMVMGYVPSVPVAGVPDRVAVPFPLSTNVTPVGSGPLSPMAGVGEPVVVTVNEPAAPVVNVVDAADVMAGGNVTVIVTSAGMPMAGPAENAVAALSM